MHLVTTAIEESWPDEGSVLFAGEWCRRFSRRSRWSTMDHDVVPYHWNNSDRLHRDKEVLDDLYERLLAELAVRLNELQAVDRSHRYWRILIGPWLSRFVQMAYDRWASLDLALSSFPLDRTTVLDLPDRFLLAHDVEDSGRVACSQPGNHHFFRLLLDRMDRADHIERLVVDYAPSVDCGSAIAAPSASRLSRRRIVEKALLVYSRLGARAVRRKDALVFGSKMPWTRDLLLAARLGQFPQYWPMAPQVTPVDVDPVVRQRLALPEEGDEFERAVRSLLPEVLPTAYLEGYGALLQKVEQQPWPSAPKAIWTCRDWRDEVFKAYAAGHLEQGTPLVMSQNSGQYGVFPWYVQEAHEIEISDRYLTWGWDDSSEPSVRPVGYVRGRRSLGVDHPRQDRMMMVNWAIEAPVHILMPAINSSRWLTYFEDHCAFVEALSPRLREALFIRLYRADCGWEQAARWRDRFPDIALDEGQEDIDEVTRGCRLLISTYNGTNNLEALAMGVPTVKFWNPEVWPLRDSAKPYFDELLSVGVYHEEPESAAAHVERVWDDVDGWWKSGEVVEAVRSFTDRFIATPRDLVKRTAGEIQAVIDGRT